MFHLELHNLFIIMTINPLPSDTKVWDMFERRGYARRHIINVEWDSAYYSSSFFDNWEWTDPKIQYFNFCTIARLRDWCEASEPKIKEYKTSDLWLAWTLIYLWKEFIRYDKVSEKKVEFIFKNDIDIDNIVKTLKTMMYQTAKIPDSFWKYM